MPERILVIGGQGRIGGCIARDLLAHTEAQVTVTGRRQRGPLPPRSRFLPLELADGAALRRAVAGSDGVVHTAGPFHRCDGRVLQACIEAGVPYVDVSDHRSFVQCASAYHERARQAGVTAILNAGAFPGISNAMACQGVAALDRPEAIRMHYLVAGSGGAGMTVMRTTFLGLQEPFWAWIGGQWQRVAPYSERETVAFPQPYGRGGTYWFDVAETYTFAHSFPVRTVTTKFGSVPDCFNHLSWAIAHWPNPWLQNAAGIEFLSRVSLRMARWSERWSGIGLAMRAQVSGERAGAPARADLRVVHSDTAAAAGAGAGSLVQLMLQGELAQPGVWPIERALPLERYREVLAQRGIAIQQQSASG